MTDLDGDGSLDLVTVLSGTVSTRLGTGTGAFGPRLDFAVGPGAAALAMGDFNGDGRPDVVTPNPGTPSPDPRGEFLPDSSATVLLVAVQIHADLLPSANCRGRQFSFA